jgi:MoaA/NifB/PqqE/SkfB family radical SAM enzyme
MGKRLGLRQWIALKLFKKLHKIRAAEHTLTTLFWECTLRCNLQCRHCGSDCTASPEYKDMPAEDFFGNDAKSGAFAA